MAAAEDTYVNRQPNKSYFTVLSRAWRLRCPRCGQSKLFAGWIRMKPECENCHLHYQREPGYFLGSIYVNYGLTALLVTIFYFVLFFTGWVSPQAALWIMAGFAVVFPLWFFRYRAACGSASITSGIPRRPSRTTPPSMLPNRSPPAKATPSGLPSAR